MKTSPSQYLELESALRAGKLTYLFGSGISGALSDAPCGWGRWLRGGIAELSDGDLAKALEDQLDAANTTNALIAVAGKIIEATKSDGCYETWMRSSLGTPALKNELLSATLRKMLLAGDIFATTNYDLLLEAATGLGTLTYSDTGEVFSMLEAGKNTAVLHLHGVYDAVSGVDNIIADTAQYKKIVENLGAQFIQNLLGTRTLVLIGCGQTTEDPNIAQFLTFAQEQLKLKRTYFFLCKEGQVPKDLPKNIIPVVYGTEHSDLQPFLEYMAQLRLRALMDANPLIGRTARSVETPSSHPLFRYHYAQQTLPFRGRAAELDALNKFLEGGSFAWWAVTGQAGAGKSRLALELLKRLGPGWFGFFVSDRAIARDAETFTPFADTLVVIDYVSGREQTVASILQMLHTVFAKTSYRLRVLLLERERCREDGTWFAILRQRMGRYNVAEFLSAEHGDGQFLYLEDLDERAVKSLIGDVCALHGLSSDEKRDSMLREAYAEKFESLRFRPLFVQLFVEAWIENDCTIPRYDRFDNLLQALVQREQARWLDAFEGDQACCNAMIRLLVRASVSGRLPIAEMPELYREDWALVEGFLRKHSFPGHQQQDRRSALLRDVCQSIGDTESTAIEPYYPDLIKEYIFAYYTDEESLSDVMNEIWEHAAQEFSAFIQRCIADFPEQDFYQQAIQVYNANTTNKEALMGRLESLITQNQQRSKDPRTLLKMLDGEQAFWRAVAIPENDPEESIALLKLMGLETIAKEYGKWIISTPDIMVEAIEEMLSVPGGEAVQMMKQVLLAEHIRQLSISGFTRDAEYLREYMSSLLESDDSELADVYRIQTSNNEMMGWLIDFDDFYRAEQILRGMVKECNYESKEAVRLLIGSCVNLMRFAAMNNRNRYVKKGFELAQQAAAQRPEDEAVRIQLVTCRTLDLYQKYVYLHAIDDEVLSAEQAAMETELESFAFTGNEERDQALSVAWFEVQILCIELLQPDEAKLRAIIAKAEEILKISPKSEDVAKAAVLATLCLHQRVLHDKVTSAEVETLFAHLEQNADSETLRDAFFQMLTESEEAAHRKNYMTEAVMSEAITDARFNPMSDSGIPEIEDRLDLLSQLDSLLPREPYRREGKKIGRNEPCPCGSGKKFKNCCQGKGVYD